MEDEHKFILLWASFTILVVLFYIWKRHKSLSKQRKSSEFTTTASSVREARRKHFQMEASTNNSERKSYKEEQNEPSSTQSETFIRRRKGKGKTSDNLINQKIITGPTMVNEQQEMGRHFDPNTGSPITQPLKTLEEALLWRPGYDEFNVARLKLNNGSHGLDNRPRTLVCHDMKGGYIEDRFVQGYPSSNCYRIYHWQYIDIFVYFSHHFVTIPPPCWTNAAHTNGVIVLGTLITEWEDGAKICSEFLEDEHSYKTLANQLVDIAEYYNFDGWLVNIENPIQPGKVQNLVDFVDYLTKSMQVSNPSGLVIWYDSVTNKGELIWQNELNSQNSQFFDVCNGIFLNYTWSLHQLNLSSHAATAHQRPKADVYVGVDVFGRGCYEGGGYKTRLAVKAAREEKLSAAIFAPGWVLETQGEENFTANQNKFWYLLSKDCPTHPMVRTIPFVTSLCQGFGENVFIDGKVALSHPWTNLSCQQTQPSFNNAFYNIGKGGIVISDVMHSLDDAYNGGGCQLVQGHTSHTLQKAKAVVRLFEADFELSTGLLVSFTYKLAPASCFKVGLQFHTDRTPTYILLCPTPDNTQDYAQESAEESKLNEMFKLKYGVRPSRLLSSSVFMSPIGKEHFEAYAPLTKNSHHLVENSCEIEDGSDQWCTRHYLITGRHLVGYKVKEIRVVCAKHADQGTDMPGFACSPFKFHVGEIKILDPIVLKQSVPTVSNLRHRNVVWKKSNTLSLTLLWDCPTKRDVEKLSYCDVYVAIGSSQSQVFCGRAFVDGYRVCNLCVPEVVHSVEFIVQAVTLSKRKRKLQDSTSIAFAWD